MNRLIIATYGTASKYLKSSGASSSWIFLLIGGLLLVTGIGWYFWDQRRKKEQLIVKKKPISLFQELCKLHRLTSSEKELLQQAIHKSSIKQGILAFLDPEIITQQATNNDAEQWEMLREKLFGA